MSAKVAHVKQIATAWSGDTVQRVRYGCRFNMKKEEPFTYCKKCKQKTDHDIHQIGDESGIDCELLICTICGEETDGSDRHSDAEPF